jgi:hypothetical protein
VRLQYVIPGARLVAVLRPAELLAHSEGRKITRALGPDFSYLAREWKRASGVDLPDVAQLVVSVAQHHAEKPQAVYAVQSIKPLDRHALLSAWGDPVPRADNASFYDAPAWSYYVPAGEENATFVIGPRDALAATIQQKRAGESLRWQFAGLVRHADAAHHVTVVFAPSDLATADASLTEGRFAAAQAPMSWLFDGGISAAMLSIHLADELYAELRLQTEVTAPAPIFVEAFRHRWEHIPSGVESYLAQADPHPHWRRVALRLPSMLRYTRDQSRIGVEHGQVVMNNVLPSIAAHNLVFAAVQLLVAPPPASGPESASGPVTVAALQDVLKAPITVRFGQESLESALENIVEEVQTKYGPLAFPFAIRILGDDLKVDGITRNQQIRDMVQEQTPVADVLTALVIKANPVTTVVSARETDQKLVWVVGPDPDDAGQQAILITTRQAAQRKYELPAVFRASAAGERSL